MSQKNNTHLGYTYWSEIFLGKDVLKAGDWKKTLQVIGQNVGFFREWILFVNIENGSVRYFVGSDRDVSVVSNGLEGFTLQAVDSHAINPPLQTGRESFLQFVTGGTLLDLKEKYEIKRSKSLEWVAFSFEP